MDSAVCNKLFKCNSCNFSSYRLKAWERDSLRRIINNKINTRKSFDGSDVTTFPTDDSALHLVIGQRNNRNCCLWNLISCKSLNCKRNNVSCLVVCFLFELFGVFHNLNRLLVSKLIFKLWKQIAFSLFCRVARNFFKHFKLALFQSFNFFELCICITKLFVDLFFLAFHIVKLFVKSFFLLLDSSLLTLNFLASIGNFFLALVSETMNLVFTLKDYFFFPCFGCFDCISHNLLCLFLSTSDFFLGCVFADGNSKENTCTCADNNCGDNADNTYPQWQSGHLLSLIF